MTQIRVAHSLLRRPARCVAILATMLLVWPCVPGTAADNVQVIKAARIYVGNGQVVKNGCLVIKNGQITAIGTDLEIPEHATVIDVGRGCVTPGLIDANARVAAKDILPLSTSTGAADAPLTEVPSGELDEADTPRADEPSATADWPPLHVGEEFDDEPAGPFAVGVDGNSVVAEQSSEVVPHTHVLDGLNLSSTDFVRLVNGGVTTVYVSPDASAVIGPRGTVVQTADAGGDRVLVPVAAVKATIGSDPSYFGVRNRTPSRYSMSIYARRPNSRMGLVWVFRKAFYDARNREQGLDMYGADVPPEAAVPVLLDVLHGKVPLRIQARIQRDILSAIRLADEFHLPFTLEEATEAYLCIDEIKAANVPVIFGPIYETATGIRGRSGEGRRSRPYTIRALLDAGIPTALSAQEMREEDGLARQAMYAMRFGVSLNDALQSVTATPAKLLGIDDKLGTLEVGKQANVVAWSGPPFAATSRITRVVIRGKTVAQHP